MSTSQCPRKKYVTLEIWSESAAPLLLCLVTSSATDAPSLCNSLLNLDGVQSKEINACYFDIHHGGKLRS